MSREKNRRSQIFYLPLYTLETNDKLLSCLTKRREVIEKLKDALPGIKDVGDRSTEDLKTICTDMMGKYNIFQRLIAIKFGMDRLCNNLVNLNAQIKDLAKEDNPVTSIFVMFETEKAQRHVLEKLTVSKYRIKNQNKNSNGKYLQSYLFRGQLMLDVAEAEEPSTIRWKELHLTAKDRMVKIITTVVVFALIVAAAFIVNACNKINENWAAMAITILNIVFPQLARLITSFERHSREEHMQVWLYFKIAFFRWINTAVVIILIMVCVSVRNAQ